MGGVRHFGALAFMLTAAPGDETSHALISPWIEQAGDVPSLRVVVLANTEAAEDVNDVRTKAQERQMRHEGRCHCGNLSVTFETALDAGQLPLRECGCSFCRKHGATAVTDPAGSLDVCVADPELVSPYQFGLRTSEFLVCRRCGVFVAAVCVIDGKTYATLNCNALDDRAAFTQSPTPVHYDSETAESRIARRRRAWTPASVRPTSG